MTCGREGRLGKDDAKPTFILAPTSVNPGLLVPTSVH